MGVATGARAATRPAGARSRRRGRLLAGWALAAGVLWPVYGWFELSTPFGADAVYDDVRGFEVVVDQGLFALYSLPGAFALWATAMTLLYLVSGSPHRRARTVRLLSRLVIGLASVGLLGVVTGLVPLFFAPQAFATPILGAAAWVAGSLGTGRARRVHLRCLGIAALAFIGVWPAVWAIGVISTAVAAALIGVFGLGWAALASTAAGGAPPQAVT